jgi:hypothetical protein
VKPTRRRFIASAPGIAALALNACSKPSPYLPVPVLPNGPVEMRVAYAVNPRLPRFTPVQLAALLEATARTAKQHFAVELRFLPLQEIPIARLFETIPASSRESARADVFDFKSGKSDPRVFEFSTGKALRDSGETFEGVLNFARPALPESDMSNFDELGAAAARLHLARLKRWQMVAALDGMPAINDAIYNEYAYWDVCGHGELPFELILTNQIIASAELSSTSIHTAIRGGYTSGVTVESRSSRYFTSAIWSTFAFSCNDAWAVEMRMGETYTADEAATLAGIGATHEIGHQLFHYGHPYLRPECVMAPTPLLAFRAATAQFDAQACARAADPAMQPGTVKMRALPV